MIVCPGPVRALDWSRDGRFLATAQVSGIGSICIWELNEPAVRLVRKINRPAATLAWSEDGRFLAFEDGGIRFWNCESGEVEVLVQSGVNETFSRRPWAIDGPLLVSTCEGFITLWDVARREPSVLQGEDDWSRSAAIWSRQGSYVACVTGPRAGDAKTPQSGEPAEPVSFSAEIWDVQKRQRIRSFTIGAGELPPQLSWSPDASLLITQMENETAIWDVSTGTRRTVIPEQTPNNYRHLGYARNVLWSPDGKTIGLLMSGEVTLWNTLDSKGEVLAGSRGGVGLYPTGFLTGPGLLATGSRLGAAARILWDLPQLRPVHRVEGTPRAPLIYLSPDGKRMAAIPIVVSPDGNFDIQISDVTTGQTGTVRLPPQGNAVDVSARWSPDSSQLAVQNRRNRQFFVIQDLKIVRKSPPEDDFVTYNGGWAPCPVWSPDSTRLAICAGSRDDIKVLEVASGATKLILFNEKGMRLTPTGEIDTLGWSEDGVHVAKNFARGSLRQIVVWNVLGSETRPGEHADEPLSRLPSRSLQDIRSSDMLISPDSKLIASARGAAVVTVWNITSGEQVAEIGTPCKEIAFAGWMSDSRHIYFRDGFIAGIVDTNSGQVISCSCNADVSSRVLGPFDMVENENTIGFSDGYQVYFADPKLNILSTLVLPSAPDTGALSVQPDGSFRIGPNAPQPYIVALVDGSQWMLTPDEFTRQYGWRNQPIERDFVASETNGPK
jgi:WD40 repeat protein